jgi:serine protease Do
VSRGWIGVSIQGLTPDLAEHFGLEDDKGVLVSAVTPNDPADKAGIKAGDIIVEFNGKPIEELGSLPRTVAVTPKGTRVKVKLLRDGKPVTLNVTVGERKEDALAGVQDKEPVTEERLGISVQIITPERARQFGLAEDARGIIVSSIEGSSPAAMAGLKRGDVIKEINRAKIKNLDDYKEAIGAWKAGNSLLLLVQRGKGIFYVTIRIGE